MSQHGRFFTHRALRPALAGLLLAQALLFPARPAAGAEVLKRREGVVLYRLNPTASPAQVDAFNRWVGARGGAHAMAFSPARSVQAVSVPLAISEERMADDLRATGAVLFAEPDYLQLPAQTPTDPSFGSQWHHTKIGSPAAWDVGQGSTGTVVAVLDTGVDATHPDLRDNVISGINIVNNSGDTTPIADHGTAVAGVIGAAANNAQGGVGLAWRLQILPVRITNNADSTAYCSDMARAIEWAADHGARAINLSYGTSGCPRTIDAAAQYARGKGALTVLAAANSGLDLSSTYPASGNVFMVGATDSADQRATFSNYGTPVDLVAPGVSIFTTVPGGRYGSWSGTSFSAPIVTGAAALLFALEPGFTPAQVESYLISTAEDLGSAGKDSIYGNGRLNVGLALLSAQSVLQGNHRPTASAGLDQTVVWPQPVALVGSAADDGLPTIPGTLRYSWKKMSGPGTVTFGQPAGRDSSATFSYAGSYILRFTASDGVLSASDDVVILVKPGVHGEGGLPKPTLSVPAILSLRSRVTAGYPSGYEVAGFDWEIEPTAPPPGASLAALSFASSAHSATWSTDGPSAELSGQGLAPGYYNIRVRAFDSAGVISDDAEAFVTLVPGDLSSARVYPNPWRRDRHSSALITFDQMSPNSTVKIFTLSGHQVRTLSPDLSASTWDLKTDSGDRVASGLYVFSITDDQGQKKIGKLAVIQ
jgi:subtilisin family serine protease